MQISYSMQYDIKYKHIKNPIKFIYDYLYMNGSTEYEKAMRQVTIVSKQRNVNQKLIDYDLGYAQEHSRNQMISFYYKIKKKTMNLIIN